MSGVATMENVSPKATSSRRRERRDIVAVRPGRGFLRNGLIAIAIASTLVFGVLYWLTAPTNGWPGLLVAHAALWFAVGVLALAYLSARIGIADDGLRVRGCFHPVRLIPRDAIESIRVIDVFRSITIDYLPHAYVCGPNGRVLLRLRGEFWSRADMEALATALHMPLTVVAEPVALAELRADYDSLVPWWQRDVRKLLRRR